MATPEYVRRFKSAEQRKLARNGPVPPGVPAARAGEEIIDWRPKFLEEFATRPVIRTAALAAEVRPAAVHYEIQHNPDFALAVMVARYMAADRMMEIAWEIAEGYAEDVYYKGIVVGQRTVRDPEMVKFLLRALDPETFDPKVRAIGEVSRYKADNAERLRMLAEGRERLKLLGKIVDAEEVAADADTA